MEGTKVIEFQKTRDFSDKLNVTFAFVRENFRSFLKAMIFIAGPPVLVASLLLSSFLSNFFKLAFGAANNPESFQNYVLSVNFWVQVISMFIFLMISYVVVIATTNNYMILYGERKTNKIDVSDVWERVRETLGMYFVTTLLFGLLTIAAYVLMLIPFAAVQTISPILIFFLFAFLFGIIFYFAVSASLVYSVRAFEKKGFFESLARSFYLVRGKWWSTFGLVVILSLLVGIISYVFSVPASILQLATSLHDVGRTGELNGPTGTIGTAIFILNSLAYISQLLLYFLPTIGLVFQYFNLVELKESKGLIGQIDTIGKPKPPPTKEERY